MLGSLNGKLHSGDRPIDCKFKLIENAIKDIRSLNDENMDSRLLVMLENELAESIFRYHRSTVSIPKRILHLVSMPSD